MHLDQRPIPIFPLPNCVLLPGAIQGLHIFEPRYREMVADELARPEGDRHIGLALLRPGYEPQYCTHQAPIHPTLCVGEIIKAQALDDGRSNIILRGNMRAAIEREIHDRSYRYGILNRVRTKCDLEPAEQDVLSRQLAEVLCILPERLKAVACEITSRETDFARAVDMLTFYVLAPEAVPAKQMILAESMLELRTRMLITLIQRQCMKTVPADEECPWPPPLSEN